VRSSRVPALLAAGLAGVLFSLTACGDDEPGSSDSPTPTAPASTPAGSASPTASASPTPSETPTPVPVANNFAKVKVTGGFGETPKVKIDTPWAIDQTRVEVLQPSEGPPASGTGMVEVNYYGVNGRTGKKFDDSFSRGDSVAFSLDQVIPGFKKGLTAQRQGSRIMIAMPGSDGYDATGGNEQAGIKVGDTLLFVVDLVAVELSGPVGKPVTPAPGLPTVTENDGKVEIAIPPTDPPKSLVVQPLIAGQGAKVGKSDQIIFDYRWVAWKDGRLLEETYTTKPATSELAELLPGMVKGMTGQRVGSRVLLVIPPAQGYPDGNPKPAIEKGETLVMVVDLLFTQKPPG
jgi:peptidylprolyl isomerase